MPPKDEKVLKPKLSEKILKDHRIFIFENICRIEDHHKWIEPMRQRLTNFGGRLPRDAEVKFAKELAVFQNSGQDREVTSQGTWSLSPPRSAYAKSEGFEKEQSSKEMTPELFACRESRDRAIYLRERNEPEPEWMKHLQTDFFKTFYEVYGRSSHLKDPLDRWELHKDLHWNEKEFSKWRNMNSRITKLTGPKPDLTYAFPIIDSTRKTTENHLLDSQAENFTLPVHAELFAREDVKLRSAPTTSLRTWQKKEHPNMDAADLICFPWAIVEAKRSKPSTSRGGTSKKSSYETFCYCQAANASAAAYKQRERLAKKSQHSSLPQEALCIFSFTCVGPTVRLWITYRDSDDTIVMDCIWATSLELTWGVLALRMVIDNMRRWVYRRVQPAISSWIGEIRARPVQQTSHTPSGDTVTRTRRAKSCQPSSQTLSPPPISPDHVPRSKTATALSRGQAVGEKSPRRPSTLKPPESASEESEDELKTDDGYVRDRTYRSPSVAEREYLKRHRIPLDEIDDLLEMSNDWYPESEKEEGYCIEEQSFPSRGHRYPKRKSLATVTVLEWEDSEPDEDQEFCTILRRRSSRF